MRAVHYFERLLLYYENHAIVVYGTSFFYWQRKLRLEAADPEQFPAVPKAGTLPQTFIEVRPVPNRKEQHFQPDMIIRKGDVVLEISNSVSPDLLNLLGGILHAE